MSDTIIFSFGLAVAIVIATAMTILIVANNRAVDRAEQHDERQRAVVRE